MMKQITSLPLPAAAGLAAGPGESLLRHRTETLRAEVASTQSKLARLREALAVRRKKLNRLLAEVAMSGSATAHRRER
jgi:hypothetical protein